MTTLKDSSARIAKKLALKVAIGGLCFSLLLVFGFVSYHYRGVASVTLESIADNAEQALITGDTLALRRLLGSLNQHPLINGAWVEYEGYENIVANESVQTQRSTNQSASAIQFKMKRDLKGADKTRPATKLSTDPSARLTESLFV